MNTIKVVHVVNSDLGLRTHLGNYIRYQKKTGYDVSAVVGPGNWLTHDTTILDGVFVKIIPLRSKISPFEDAKSLMRLVRYFRENRFDIVHTHSLKPGFLGRLAAKLVGIPIAVHTFHGLSIYEGMPAFQYILFKIIDFWGSQLGDSVLSQGKEDMEIAVKENLCPAAKIHFLGNGIDLERFNPQKIEPSKIANLRAEFEILPHQTVVGFIGRSEKEKGICEFIEAINILKKRGVQAKYLILGAQQPEKKTAISPAELLEMCEANEDIVLLGYRTDMPALLSLMDIVTLPSYHEGIPRCLMESAAMGKPVIATQIRGVRETVLDGETGILVPVRSSTELAEGIFRLISHPELREKMGENARNHALKNFDERLFFYRTDVEYRRLVKEKLNKAVDSILQPL